MKKRWLSVITIILVVCMLAPMVVSCGFRNKTQTDTSSGSNAQSTDTNTGSNVNTGSNSNTGSEDIKNPTGTATVLGSQSAPVVRFLRIAEIGENSVTVKFNLVGQATEFEVRTSNKEIKESNYDKATVVECEVTGDGAIKTIVIPGIVADADNRTFISVKAKNGFAESSFETVRAGGIYLVKLDHTNPQHLCYGETNRNLTPLIDEQDIVGDPYREDYDDLPSSNIGQFWYEKGHVFPNYTKTETDERYGTKLAPIIDLTYVHYVDCVMLFYEDVTHDVVVRASKKAANFNTSEAWDFEISISKDDLIEYGFNKIEINKEVRYVQVEFVDGQAPTEALVYGYAVGEDEDMLIQEETHQRPTLGEMMGQCGFVAGGGGNCTVEQLACSYVIREYHNVGWSYSNGSFPGKAVNLINTVVGNFDRAYKEYSEAGFMVVPCLQWNEGSSPARVYDDLEGKLSTTIASWEEKYLPDNYAAYADLIYQYAARYGSSKMGYLVENMLVHSDATEGATAGRGYLQWIELGNEPNGEDAAGATAYQLAALTSAAYDGHQRTLLKDYYNPNSFSYPFGGKNADPDIKLAIAGLAGIQDRYIMAMAYWMRANRTDGCIAMDAFNVHTYFGKYFTMNGQQIIVGVSPEEFGLVDALSRLVEFRDKYYPGVQVWLTEFGWDTNQSYETMTSAHAYATRDLNGDGRISDYEKVMRAREIQGMWLVRAYILLSSCGVDVATMYMCEDAGTTSEQVAIGKYGTCGIWATPYNENNYRVYDAVKYKLDDKGNATSDVLETVEVYMVEAQDADGNETKKYYKSSDDTEIQVKSEENKDGYTIVDKIEAKAGYYYMYTLYKTLGDMTFVKEIDSGNEDVWIYEFADGRGRVGYAVWCPTSNNTEVENFQLRVNGSTATLVQTDSDNKVKEGVSTNLQINDGTVTITVRENPVYVVVE